jgi:hypothetical protein
MNSPVSQLPLGGPMDAVSSGRLPGPARAPPDPADGKRERLLKGDTAESRAVANS